MSKKRIQLTLFVEETESVEIERIRKEFNPEQYSLIKSHVTLCREDELEQIDKITQTLKMLDYNSITIDFGKVVRFSNRKGVMLPSIGDNEPFKKLRKSILMPVNIEPIDYFPHITLMHPRNSTCTDIWFEQIEKFILPVRLEFKKISVIEKQGGNKWNVIKEFSLQS
ncbi:MAG: 2'-5' RNA ligase family protein [Sediminibacterium sp.]